MNYSAVYYTTVLDTQCRVMLRGLFDDGKYFGDVYVPHYQLVVSIDGRFCGDDTDVIHQLIPYLVSANLIESKLLVDFSIGEFPIGSPKILFRHYLNYTHEDKVEETLMQLKMLLEKEITPKIQEGIEKWGNWRS